MYIRHHRNLVYRTAGDPHRRIRITSNIADRTAPRSTVAAVDADTGDDLGAISVDQLHYPPGLHTERGYVLDLAATVAAGSTWGWRDTRDAVHSFDFTIANVDGDAIHYQVPAQIGRSARTGTVTHQQLFENATKFSPTA